MTRWIMPLVGLAVFVAALLALMVRAGQTSYQVLDDADRELLASATTTPSTTTTPTTTTSTTTTLTTTTTTTTTTTEPPYQGWVDPTTVGGPWGDTVEGVLTFRGSPTRSWHGEGPVPGDPVVAWRFPDDRMCSMTSISGEQQQWCGMGWTGQPAVFERGGRTWVVFGAYDAAVHFVDGETGERLLPDFPTGDIIKGSVTVDPDGYPLVYAGSRDDRLRVLAFDRDEPVELWSLHAYDVEPTMWNNDWDSSPLVLDDHLFAGGENSRFHVVRLNRGYDADGLVTVDPVLVWDVAGWDDELLDAVGGNVSIETSPLVIGDVLYFANSGGLVQGWDIGGLRDGVEPTRVFRFWAGDDVDATLVADDEGMLYVGVEYERGTDRSHELGQVLKLDPSRPDDPLVWAVEDRPHLDSGVWATPAVYGDLLIVPTDEGKVHAIDRASGEVAWTMKLPGPTWSSPTIVDDMLVMGDCSGRVLGLDLSDPSVEPVKVWEVATGACVESSAAIWRGTVYMGSRDGYLYALRDPD